MAEKILIVDDDLETLRLVGLMLQRQGYQALAANNGRQALSMASSEHPDAILLDVMMPDMDGYEVTRILRKMPETVNTPIMMFTAKSLVDDRVAGFEAGVDDYITKPVHPSELVAHIKSMLARGRSRSTSTAERGHVTGFLAAKGGLGVSTIVLNLAITLQKRTKSQVIAAEMRPGNGTWGLELGFANSNGLNNLLQLKAPQINLSALDRELLQTSFGVRLLLASNHPKDCEVSMVSPQMEALLQELPLLGSYILLDIGAVVQPGMEKIYNHCQELFVVTEAFPTAVQRTRLLIDDLENTGYLKNKLTVIVYNKMRSEIQLSVGQVQEMLGMPIQLVFPPAPESAYHAAMRSVPLTNFAPESAQSMQFIKLAEMLTQRVGK